VTEASYPIAVSSFLGIWLLLSLLTTARCRWVAGRKRWDVFQMLSGWRLFVAAGDARPAAYPILFRDRLRDGTITPLQVAFKGTAPLRLSTGLWSTARDEQILARRLAKDLLKQERVHRGSRAALEMERSHRHLWHIIRHSPAPVDAESRQFVILATTGVLRGRPPIEVFRSAFHPL
jgi:hypothetical protein